MIAWRAFMKKYYPEGGLTDASNVLRLRVARTLVQVLKQCGDNLTRENVMKQAANLKDFDTGDPAAGITINTSPTDFAPIKQCNWCGSTARPGFASATCRHVTSQIVTRSATPRRYARRPVITVPGDVMSLISFIKDAGEKLFGKGEAKPAQEAAQAAPTPENIAAAERQGRRRDRHYIRSQGLRGRGPRRGATTRPEMTVTVSGVAADQATKEKVVLCCGNVHSVSTVNDLMTVKAAAQPEAQWYTVVEGRQPVEDLEAVLRRREQVPQIFEANKPMPTHPDKIYPGQVLRIPPAA